MLNKIIYTILGIGLAFLFFPHANDNGKNPSVSGVLTQKAEAHPEHVAPEMAISLSAPLLTAKSAVVFDLDSGTVLYSKNLDEKMPIASLTKLMTALVVMENADLNAEVTVRNSGFAGIGSTVGLVEGEKITVLDLLKAMLIPSGNDAAWALADHISGSPEQFAELMNRKVEKLNLHATKFSNALGWDSWAQKENFSNSLDLIKITKEFLQNPTLAQIVKTKDTVVTSVDGKYTHHLRTTNKLLLENSNVQGVKTGFTSKALGNLIILYTQDGNNLVSIVLDSQNREEDSQKLLDWTLKVYRW